VETKHQKRKTEASVDLIFLEYKSIYLCNRSFFVKGRFRWLPGSSGASWTIDLVDDSWYKVMGNEVLQRGHNASRWQREREVSELLKLNWHLQKYKGKQN